MASAREGSDEEVRDVALLPEPPRGPLQAARARASFPWRELALFWEGEDTLRFKVRPGHHHGGSCGRPLPQLRMGEHSWVALARPQARLCPPGRTRIPVLRFWVRPGPRGPCVGSLHPLPPHEPLLAPCLSRTPSSRL